MIRQGEGMERVHPMRRSVGAVGIVVVMMIAALVPVVQCQGADKPNVIVFQTDEHNFRTIGAYREHLSEKQAFPWGNGVAVTTPHIDSLADNGSIATKFYANTPVCAPARAAFVSGHYPQNTPVVSNGVHLDDDIITYSKVLKDAGYVTGFAGKWHLDAGKPGWEPSKKFGFTDNRYMYNRGHWKKFEITSDGPRVACRDGKDDPTYGLCDADSQSFSTDWLTDRALEFLEENKDKPFSYFISYPDPHGPNSVRPPYDEMYTHFEYEKPATSFKVDAGLPPWGVKDGNTESDVNMAHYFGNVKLLDDNIGRVVKYLKENSLLNNTILIFTSDHGDLLGEHDRTNKGVPYEASAKIPFIAHYPDKIPKGTVINQSISTVDFMPTLLGLMDINSPVEVEGKDASALFLGKRGTWDDLAFMRGTGKKANAKGVGPESWVGVFTSRYKLIFDETGEPWLLDLKEDPDELVNHINRPENQVVIKHLAKKLKEYGTTYKDPRVQHDHVSKGIEKILNNNSALLQPRNRSRSAP
jgi:arylsulfatase A-like enzyme